MGAALSALLGALAICFVSGAVAVTVAGTDVVAGALAGGIGLQAPLKMMTAVINKLCAFMRASIREREIVMMHYSTFEHWIIVVIQK
jgi:hypothetical protein